MLEGRFALLCGVHIDPVIYIACLCIEAIFVPFPSPKIWLVGKKYEQEEDTSIIFVSACVWLLQMTFWGTMIMQFTLIIATDHTKNFIQVPGRSGWQNSHMTSVCNVKIRHKCFLVRIGVWLLHFESNLYDYVVTKMSLILTEKRCAYNMNYIKIGA